MPTKEEFGNELKARLREAELGCLLSLAVNAGTLHRQMGGYPLGGNRMPACCDAMYDEIRGRCGATKGEKFKTLMSPK